MTGTVSSKPDDQVSSQKNKLIDTAKFNIGNQSILDRNRIHMDSEIHPVWAISINGELRSLSKPLALRVPTEGHDIMLRMIYWIFVDMVIHHKTLCLMH